ncbi:hypothetical protein B0H12DRAFT_1160633 [Mycena haematopus]|nr:hypothetical protein B0H12DRAFT_1160633 [Mycena haematopus]
MLEWYKIIMKDCSMHVTTACCSIKLHNIWVANCSVFCNIPLPFLFCAITLIHGNRHIRPSAIYFGRM